MSLRINFVAEMQNEDKSMAAFSIGWWSSGPYFGRRSQVRVFVPPATSSLGIFLLAVKSFQKMRCHVASLIKKVKC